MSEEQGMQWIDTDYGRPEISGDIDQFAQISEVADAPVIRALERVELGGNPPALVLLQ